MRNSKFCAGLRTSLVAAALTLGLAGCGPDGPNKADTGLAVGAITGGLIGSAVGNGNGKIAAAAIGAFVGGVVGNEIGRSLDEQDRRFAQQAEYAALERGRSGERTEWRNPDSGHAGSITPIRTYQTSDGVHCREFTQTIWVEGRAERAHGTACREPDGSWWIDS